MRARSSEQARDDLADLYPKDPDGATPIAYLWARTVRCESPNCGAEIPLMRSSGFARKPGRKRALQAPCGRAPRGEPRTLSLRCFEPNHERGCARRARWRRAKATCLSRAAPYCRPDECERSSPRAAWRCRRRLRRERAGGRVARGCSRSSHCGRARRAGIIGCRRRATTTPVRSAHKRFERLEAILDERVGAQERRPNRPDRTSCSVMSGTFGVHQSMACIRLWVISFQRSRSWRW